MKKMITGVLGALLLMTVAALAADMPEMPEMPKPQAEHEWLQKLVGEWTTDGKMYMDPDQPPMESTGSETTTSLGGFWVVSEMTSSMPGMDESMEGRLTLGYDPAKGTYVGTWIDSANSHLWVYEGTREGDKLTLETEGPCPMAEGAIMQFREVVEIQSDDARTFTSYLQGEDDEWMKIMEITYTRKK